MANYLTKPSEDYSKWYNEIIEKAQLAESSGVRGCMTIKPYGFSIWEKMQADLDRRFKETGHTNAYFPLFIPKSHLSKEAEHVEGFAKECAVVTHYRLKNDSKEGVIVDPDAKLEEELIVRPTSETIIWDSYKRWIQSHRDLPILINQWANVVRWEMRTRLFLRTAEFLWQEGHTAHITKEEALEETVKMANVYESFLKEVLAIPVIMGTKTKNERFSGAVETYCLEALVQDGKAIQAGTSHFLGQNFPKAFDVKFTDKDGKISYPWATSWGVSTRLMGTLVMMHSDEKGLVLPPKVAPIQVVIIPIYKNSGQLNSISKKVKPLIDQIKSNQITITYDDCDTKKPGWKFSEYELKGIPIRIVIGPKDLENNTLEINRRDTGEKEVISFNEALEVISTRLESIQENLFNNALNFQKEHTTEVHSFQEFKTVLDEKGGFISAHWDGTTETELAIKEETKATIRCIPMNNKQEEGICIFSGRPSKQKVLFAKSY